LWTRTTEAYANGRAETFENDVKNLKNWLNHHIAWIDQQMETEDSFVSAFMERSEDLKLDASEDGKGMILKIDSACSGDAVVFVNGRKFDEIRNVDGSVSCEIPAKMLTAESGKMNVVEVKVLDSMERVIARNYMTVKIK